jgi:RNA polymerase sigma factor (sigma-70 family)
MAEQGDAMSFGDLDDHELLSTWRSGDLGAGEELLKRYASNVVRFFLAKVRCPHAAADMTQRTFLACVQGRHRIRGESSFRSYLFGTAHNVHREYKRRVARDPAVEPSEREMDPSPTASGLIAGLQEQRLLLEAVRRLPEEYQEVYELKYWEGLSGREIGEVLGCPEGTVRTRLRAGREKLQELLTQLQKESLHATATTFDLWAKKLREMIAKRKPPKKQ